MVADRRRCAKLPPWEKKKKGARLAGKLINMCFLDSTSSTDVVISVPGEKWGWGGVNKENTKRKKKSFLLSCSCDLQ